jgi:glutathione S-transferase
MAQDDRIPLLGAPGSPYTRKMLGVLRYRRIAYRFLVRGSPELKDLPSPKVALLPTFYLPGETGELEAVTDSTPLIRRLEREHQGRSIIPPDPAIAFLDELIEDYADEWLTKAMFHYRWAYQQDIDKASQILPCWQTYSIPNDVLAERAKMIGDRQIGRLFVVGSNAVTGPVIEASYRRFLQAMEAHLAQQPFVLGSRPAACDFALYGQLTQLVEFDPTPRALAEAIAPRVCAWTGVMEDLSGLEPAVDGWISPDAIPATLSALTAEIGRVYPPVMLANARALMSGANAVETEVDGARWTQPPFPYQGKCLQWLRQSYASLPNPARAKIEPLLRCSGIGEMLD